MADYEYAYEPQSQSIGSTESISFTGPSQTSERIQQVKVLDERLNKLDALVQTLADRIAPALHNGLDSIAEEISEMKSVPRNDSDVVAHLRHTAARVAGLCDRVSALTQRVDL